mmetsp:Transcript_107831/g.301954  ORF Transcript_107831/g.301954 Transcript_107831/m.301954 type:complete len:236 (-) Transcript_107831:632-1339(-)
MRFNIGQHLSQQCSIAFAACVCVASCRQPDAFAACVCVASCRQPAPGTASIARGECHETTRGDINNLGVIKRRGVSRGEASVSEANRMTFPQMWRPTVAAAPSEAPSRCDVRRSSCALAAAAWALRKASVATRSARSASLTASWRGTELAANCRSASLRPACAPMDIRQRATPSRTNRIVASQAMTMNAVDGLGPAHMPASCSEISSNGTYAVQRCTAWSASSKSRCSADILARC